MVARAIPTRRDVIRGGAVVGGGLIAGCSGQDSSGEIEFDAVPDTWETYFPGYADMGVALGRADGLTAVGFTSRYHTWYYDELDGVAVDVEDIALRDGAVYARGPPETVVTEQLLAEVFGIEATVEASEHGPRVTPERPLQDPRGATPGEPH